jgi:fructose-bisphosphate aldolase class II
MSDICKARYEAFNTVGNASKIKPISLDSMFDLYKSNSLKAVIK